jgi:hypothetical protein
METFITPFDPAFFTPLSPDLQLYYALAVVAVGALIGAAEAFYECKLHRSAPWGSLCSWGEKRKSPR